MPSSALLERPCTKSRDAEESACGSAAFRAVSLWLTADRNHVRGYASGLYVWSLITTSHGFCVRHLSQKGAEILRTCGKLNDVSV